MDLDKLCKVVMLPTNEKAVFKGQLILNKDNNTFYVSNRDIFKEDWIKLCTPHLVKPHHIYIVSDEEIKECDWCFNSYDNRIWKYKSSPCPLPFWGNKYTLIKIIASTDKSLGLPQLSQEFLEAYVKAYNEGKPLTEVIVEYHEGYWKDLDSEEDDWVDGHPMVNSDNTISIRIIKYNWNREEILTIIE